MNPVYIGRYEIKELLGQGGMGAVYSALDPVLEREVAIKVILPKRATVEARERFFREARAVARLDSPYIVKVYDMGTHADGNKEMHYLVMEYVRGRTLTETTEGQGVPSRTQLIERLKFYWQLLKSMEYAHGQGVVHRDLKPDNVMINEEGRLKIMDFGLAILDERHSQTRDDQIMGTLAYFAPEQAKGGKGVDHRADIYSLGVIMYELCTGELPFLGSNPIEMIHKVLHEPPAKPTELNPALPWPVEKMLLQSLRKDPDERYQRVTEMIRDLELILRESFQVVGAKLDPDGMPDLTPRAVPSAPAPPVPAQPLMPSSSSLDHPIRPPVLPPIAMVLPKVPPPPSLEATMADLRSRLGGETPPARPTAESRPTNVPTGNPTTGGAEPAPRPEEKSPSYFMKIHNNPVVVSREWLSEAGSSEVRKEQQREQLKKDDERQKELTPPPGTSGRRAYCLECGAEVAFEVRACPECGRPLNPSTSATVVSREARELAVKAADLLRQRAFDQALEVSQRAVQLDKDLGEAHLCLGKAQVSLHLLDEAEVTLEKAIDLMPTSHEPHLVLAELYLERQDFEGVIACLLEALQRRQEDVETRCRLAFLYSETGRAEQALEQYKKVLRTHARHLAANRQLGVLLASLNRTDEAIRYLEIANEIEPSDAYSCTLLGRLYARKRQYARAREAFQTVIQIKGEDATLRAELGALYQAENREDLAIPELRRAIQVDPGNREASLRLAALYQRSGNVAEAVRLLEESLRCHPEDVQLHRKLGDLYLKKDLNRAMMHFENVVKLDPRCAEMHNKLGRIYLKKNYTDQSIEHYKQAIELHKSDPEFREDLAMAYYCKGDFQAAIQELHKATMIGYGNAEYHKGLGMMYYTVGQDAEATQQLQYSLQLQPNDAQSHGMLGLALARQKLTNFAIAEFQKALELDPKLAVLHLYLARTYAGASRHNEAIESFKAFDSKIAAFEESPFLGQAYAEMGQSYLAQNQPSRAAEVFQMALQRNPKDVAAIHGLAKVALARADFGQALEKLTQAEALEPRSGELARTRADVETAQGNLEGAVETLRKAVQEHPNDSKLAEELGRSLRRCGKFKEAIGIFRKASEQFPAEAWRFWWMEARVEHRQMQYGRACWLFRQALQVAPQSHAIMKDLAESCHGLGELDEALTVLDKALQVAPAQHQPPLLKLRSAYEAERKSTSR